MKIDEENMKLYIWKLEIQQVNNYGIFDIGSRYMYNIFLYDEKKSTLSKILDNEIIIIKEMNCDSNINMTPRYNETINFDFKKRNIGEINLFSYLSKTGGSQFLCDKNNNDKFYPFENTIKYLEILNSIQKKNFYKDLITYIVLNLIIVIISLMLDLCISVFWNNDISMLGINIYMSLLAMTILFNKNINSLYGKYIQFPSNYYIFVYITSLIVGMKFLFLSSSKLMLLNFVFLVIHLILIKTYVYNNRVMSEIDEKDLMKTVKYKFIKNNLLMGGIELNLLFGALSIVVLSLINMYL